MSLNAGGGNLGRIFSTLTYSVMMAACTELVSNREGVISWLLVERNLHLAKKNAREALAGEFG